MAETLLQRAQRSLAIQDVYLVQAEAWADRAFDPTAPVQEIAVHLRVAPQAAVELNEVGPPDSKQYVVRYFIETGLRIVKPGVKESRQTLERSDLLSEITATFALRYLCVGDERPTEELLKIFEENAVHHMWPYWREFLQASTGRLRVPPVVLPMRHAMGQLPSTTDDDESETAEPQKT